MKNYIIKFARKFKFLSVLIIISFILTPFLIYQNESLTVTDYVYENAKMDPELNDYRIVQLSDIHNKTFGKRLVDKVKELAPDMIALTGDIIDDKTREIDRLGDFLNSLTLIAPVYFVSGNNELSSGKYEILNELLIAKGIVVLEDESVTVRYNSSEFNLIGLRDPAFIDGLSTMPENATLSLMQATIDELTTEGLNVMLAHRPSIFSTYASGGADLVLTGHAHGGQIRLPFIGGLVSPDEGLFPTYTEGRWNENNTTMIISRGLGNSIIPFRIFNRPEIVVVNFSIA